VDVLNRLFASSRGEYRDVQEARHLLLQAQLDSAEKTADRIALYKSEIDSMKKLEEIAGSHVKRGTGTVATVLQAKARRLAVEIQLEREMIKQAKEGR
jgi:hypothetical protein